MENQMDQFRQQAASAGFSGSAVVDIHPALGVIRLKLNIVPPEALADSTANLSQTIALMLGALNITVKKHISKEEKQ